MVKYVLFLALSLLFVSCKDLSSLKPSEKAFDREDSYILFALRAEEVKDYISASELFTILYEKSLKQEYLYRSLQNDLLAKKYIKLIKRVDVYLKDSPQDPVLQRLKVVSLFDLNRLDEATTLSISLAKMTKNPNDYILVSDIYSKRQEYDTALKYLESAYTKEYNEKILDRISIILYVNLNRKKEAIAQLETHSRMLGCSERICMRLIGFYSNENNVDGLLATYLRLYKSKKNEEIAKKIVQIYSYKKDYLALMNFLEHSSVDDEVLLQLYTASKNYDKAYVLSQKLYERTSQIDYLGRSAIYEYESAKDKNKQELIQRVVRKLKKVILEDKGPVYLNYLGYILIDHEIDVKIGMDYIDRVLKMQPNSSYYLDSKAWGYYKLGKCEKAKKIMQRVVKLDGGDDPEVLFHLKKIEKCLKNKKVISKK
ncbi:hypothetical protein [Sulfurimonas sp.]|uniref:hypothetical protein n=1 Tax=Sulfurimonas sp. TaxID=2022749 RepID=UPI00260010F2|nr:hypothetical protein [Sulfurimonas sp.]MBT5935389.1 hypothetical protein [Sulfurimonas sp.]